MGMDGGRVFYRPEVFNVRGEKSFFSVMELEEVEG
jgi:hypothetical protein